MDTYLSRDKCEWGPSIHNEEHPARYVFDCKNAWKYQMEPIAVDKTMNLLSYNICFFFPCLFEERYTYKF